MQQDIQNSERFRTAHNEAIKAHRPGSGLLLDAADPAASADGLGICFTGSVTDKLEGPSGTRLCLTDSATGATRILTVGSGNQRHGRWSPDSSQIAFLSDREQAGLSQLQLMDTRSGLSRPGPQVNGLVEYLQWDATGAHVLLGVAGVGADLTGAQGGITLKLGKDLAPDWAPKIDVGADDSHWRHAYVADLTSHTARRVSPQALNVWESAWCGGGAIVASVSDSPDEAAWYRARVVRIDVESGEATTLYTPARHLGKLCGSPGGGYAAVIEAICSDRTIVAGNVMLIDTAGGHIEELDTAGVDVSSLEWRNDSTLLFAGHRSFETVVGSIDLGTRQATTLWSSSERTIGDHVYPGFCMTADGQIAAVTQSMTEPPALELLGASPRVLARFGCPGLADEVRSLVGQVRQARWKAPDGLEIHGWVLTPAGSGPFPTVLEVHGGPVWQWRHRWLGLSLLRRLLMQAGYAIMLPNPRGSSGRGQDYAGAVFGDMGGADTGDLLSGVDALVADGTADPQRLFVWGGSYGGFMSSWLVTQDRRFSAAVPVSPVTNWYSEHLSSQIPYFSSLFLQDDMTVPGGKYHSRSPVMHVRNVRTPVLNICGALDRNTPPGQALEFHTALKEQGVETVLLTYPQEGHGVRNYPAAIDFAARVWAWFDGHAAGPSATRHAERAR